MDASDTTPGSGESVDGDEGDTSDRYTDSIACRVDADLAERLDRAVYEESQPGVNLSRSDIVRAALGWYLDEILEDDEEGEE